MTIQELKQIDDKKLKAYAISRKINQIEGFLKSFNDSGKIEIKIKDKVAPDGFYCEKGYGAVRIPLENEDFTSLQENCFRIIREKFETELPELKKIFSEMNIEVEPIFKPW